ncbi:MAG: thiamine pyrophosphate-binding protein, partial [Verrucomicrobiota bacterium]
MSENAVLAATTISSVIDWGVCDFVVCAGARNVPLIVDLEAREGLNLWHHFDERAAAFFALGLTKKNLRPVAVVTTSGTAVAEMLPAVVEAFYSGLPLICVTADRPRRFRGTGAPQSIEQVGIFSTYAQCGDFEKVAELPEMLNWNQASPLHLNLCFEEPKPEPATAASPIMSSHDPQPPEDYGFNITLVSSQETIQLGVLR